jgi:hypothetical protein
MAKKIAWTEQAKADVCGIDRLTAIDLLHRLARLLATEGFAGITSSPR